MITAPDPARRAGPRRNARRTRPRRSRPRVRDAIARARERGTAVTIVTGRMFAATRAVRADARHRRCRWSAIKAPRSSSGDRRDLARDAGAPGRHARGAGVGRRAPRPRAVLRRRPALRAADQPLLQALYRSRESRADRRAVAARSLRRSAVDQDRVGRRSGERVGAHLAALAAAARRPRVSHAQPCRLRRGRSIPSVNKGEALAFVAQRYGATLDETLAIGDAWNDVPLLDAAGIGVAMGSGPPELFARADAVVGDVAHDGVAEAIERFVLSVTVRARASAPAHAAVARSCACARSGSWRCLARRVARSRSPCVRERAAISRARLDAVVPAGYSGDEPRGARRGGAIRPDANSVLLERRRDRAGASRRSPTSRQRAVHRARCSRSPACARRDVRKPTRLRSDRPGGMSTIDAAARVLQTGCVARPAAAVDVGAGAAPAPGRRSTTPDVRRAAGRRANDRAPTSRCGSSGATGSAGSKRSTRTA